jgi:hypothetical protein
MPNLEKIIEFFKSEENQKRLRSDSDRYMVYNGKVKDLVRAAIQKEFLLPETVEDMVGRIIPINITQKIVNKLSQVYREAPVRRPSDLNDADQESLDFYVNETNFNRIMKNANRMFKLHKHVCLEPYVCSNGIPSMRVLPSQTYTPFSDDPIDPKKPTAFLKHIKMDQDATKQIHEYWTNEEHLIINGNGEVLFDEMLKMNNPDGINPYGVIPFVYIKDSDNELIPIQDDDLISMQLAINLLLTDLAFATKYQSWSIFYLIGIQNQKISFNPNSVITLDHAPGTEKPEIGTIKPELDSDAMLRQVEALVAMLLTTKSLSVGSVSGQLDAKNPASGIAKVLDESETTEERKDQVAFFEVAEKDFWFNFAHKILPVWTSAGIIDPSYVMPFTEPFELSIIFPDFKPMIGEKDKVELLKAKLDAGFISFRMAIKELYPNISDLELDSYVAELRKEKLDNMQFFQNNIQQVEETEEEEEPIDGDSEA